MVTVGGTAIDNCYLKDSFKEINAIPDAMSFSAVQPERDAILYRDPA
jgi:hypothetical protein